MKTIDSPRIGKKLSALARQAETFVNTPELLASIDAAIQSPKLAERAMNEPRQYLESQGVKVPPSLDVAFGRRPPPTRPVPDYEFFTIRLFKCRTFWLKKREGPGFEEVQICFGIQIVPNPLPRGPIAVPAWDRCGTRNNFLLRVV